MRGLGIKWILPRSLRGYLLLLGLAIFIPLLGVQAFVFHQRLETRKAEELRADLDLARDVAMRFEDYVTQVLGEEQTLGLNLILMAPHSVAESNNALTLTKNGFDFVRDLAWATPAGRIVAASNSQDIGRDIHGEAYAAAIVQGKEWVLTDLEPPGKTNRFDFVIARGVRDGAGNLKGEIFAWIDPARIKRMSDLRRHYDSARIAVFDRRGQLVYSDPHIALVWRQRRWADRDPLLRQALTGQEAMGSTILPVDGRKYLSACVPLGKLGWAVEVSRPVQEAMKPVMTQMRYDLVIVCGVTLLAVLLAGLISREIATRVDRLRQRAVAATGLDAGFLKPVTAIRELDEMGNAFDRMARQLAEQKFDAQRQAGELDTIFRSMLVPMAIFDERGKLVKVNPVAQSMYGFTPEEHDTERCLERLKMRYDDGRPVARQDLPFVRALGGERVRHQSLIFKDMQGQDVYIIASASPILVGGKVTGAVAIWQDVTQLRQTQEALRKSEGFIRRVVDSSRDCIKVLDLEGRLLFMNQGGQRLMEISDLQPYLGTDLSEFWAPEDRPRVREAVARAAAGGVDTFQKGCRTVKGKLLWWDELVTPILGADGKPERVLIISRDMTEQKRAEDALRESEERFRTAFEKGAIPMAMTAMDGTFLKVNSAFAEMLGCTASELAGRNYADFTHPDDAGENLVGTRRLACGGSAAFRMEKRYVRKDGGIIWGDMSTAAVHDSRGEPMYCVTHIQDITDRKKAEEKLKRFNEELERRVAERTAQLQETVGQLRQSNKDLEQFAYVSSHDLQEPLRMVASYVGMLEGKYEGTLDGETREFMGYIVEGAVRMQNLLRDLLAFSEVRFLGKPFAPVDGEKVLADALQELRPAMDESLARVTHDPLPTVIADDRQLRQLFINLLDNAIKFRRKDQSPQVHVTARAMDGQWRFAVRDNGIGIEARHYDRIFNIFQRLHTRREYPGNGIGLSIAKRIAERHGGSIWLDSRVGEGSVFFFTIPKEPKSPR